jgi:hypothetical protein
VIVKEEDVNTHVLHCVSTEDGGAAIALLGRSRVG